MNRREVVRTRCSICRRRSHDLTLGPVMIRTDVLYSRRNDFRVVGEIHQRKTRWACASCRKKVAVP